MSTKRFKISTWNVNSVRSRLEHISIFLKEHDPDILLLQETKCTNEQFPHDFFSSLPYNITVHGQKSYNGVAVFSKYPIEDISIDFPSNPCPEQARFLEVTCQTPIGYSRIVSIYVPNGGMVGSDKFVTKLKFLDALRDYLASIKSPDENLIIGGDFNVAPFDIDVFDPSELQGVTCFTDIEKTKMREILGIGLTDIYRSLYPSSQEFSWWDYRAAAFRRNMGMRIDFILGCGNAASKLSECYMDKPQRELPTPSDHIPVVVEFNHI